MAEASNQPSSYALESQVQQSINGNKSPIIKHENSVPSDADRNSQRLCDEQLCGVATIHRPQEGQNAVSRPFVPICLSGIAIPSFEYAMSRVCNFSASMAVADWIMSAGLPAVKLREPPLQEGKSRVRWTCVSSWAAKSRFVRVLIRHSDCTNSVAAVECTMTISRSGLVLPRT